MTIGRRRRRRSSTGSPRATGSTCCAPSDAEARDLVRRGRRIGAVRVPAGFGAASQHLFYGASPKVELRVDPARKAESAMLQGFPARAGRPPHADAVQRSGRRREHGGRHAGRRRNAPAGSIAGQDSLQHMLGSIDTFLGEQKRLQTAATGGAAAAPAPSKGWQPIEIAVESIERKREGPANGYQIAFPQGMQWGILGCMMSFAVSLAVERSRGTLTRLLMSPAPSWALLAGKGLACYMAITIVQATLMTIGASFFGVRPSSVPLLIAALVIVPIAFVGIMMFVASLGTTEQGLGRRRLGHHDADVDARRRHGAAGRDAGLDAVAQRHQPGALDDPGLRGRDLAQLLGRRNGHALCDPRGHRARLLRARRPPLPGHAGVSFQARCPRP
jgi:hypothetical protein